MASKSVLRAKMVANGGEELSSHAVSMKDVELKNKKSPTLNELQAALAISRDDLKKKIPVAAEGFLKDKMESNG